MSKGLEPGMTIPDFELPDEAGTLHRLSNLQGEKPMVLCLGRGEHCPRERQHQRELLKFHEWCATAVTELVTILPGTLHDALKLRMSTGAHWPFLADVELDVQKTFDIEEYVDTRHTATVPHTLVLEPGLKIFSSYVGFWYWGRPSPYDLWADLRELRKKVNENFDPTIPEVRAAWEASHKRPAGDRQRPRKREPARRRGAKTV